jgi:hypothetical protein
MFSLTALLRRVPDALLILFLLALCALAAIGVRSWLASRDAAAQLATTLAAQRKLLDEDDAREQQRDAALAKTLDTVAHAKAAVTTPAQAVAAIPQALPPLPLPITLNLPETPHASPSQTTDAAGSASAPAPAESSAAPVPSAAPAAVLTVPQPDLQPLYDYLEDCRGSQTSLAAAQADLADEKSKTSALTSERDAALRAARGGGFWARFKHGAKWLAIGAAAGALAVEASRH